MADLDVSDVLDDLMFNSPLCLIRGTGVTGQDGLLAITRAAPVTVIGVIQPAGAKDLDRLGDLSRSSGAVQIWTRFPMAVDAPPVTETDGVTVITPGTVADMLIANGSTYTVMTCDPWLYGSSYWHSLASLTSLS